MTAWLFASLFGIGSLLWLRFQWNVGKALEALPLLEEQARSNPKKWPTLSVVVAARDEAATIEAAARTLLALDYPEMELLLVNDRSGDETGEIIDRLAAADGRVTAVHVTHLPDGWLGKVNALQAGIQQSKGEWILFTDADVHFSQKLLQQAISLALLKKVEHLAILPGPLKRLPFLLDLAVSGFLFLLLTGYKPHTRDWQQADPAQPVGVGAFNLFTRQAYERSEGLEWLKMEVVDDLGLGVLLARAGAKSYLACSMTGLRLDWYPDLASAFRGLEKNLFGAMAGYDMVKLVGMVAFLCFMAVSPLLLLSASLPGVPALGGLALLASLWPAKWVVERFKQNPLPIVLIPFGILFVSFFALNSGFKCMRRKGIVWRDSFYSLDKLRAGHRLKITLQTLK